MLLYWGYNDEKNCPHEAYGLTEQANKRKHNCKAGDKQCGAIAYLRTTVSRYKKIKQKFSQVLHD